MMRKDARLDEVTSSESTFTQKNASIEKEEITKEPWYKKLRSTKNDRDNDRSSSNK
jgi:hypothetical protein